MQRIVWSKPAEYLRGSARNISKHVYNTKNPQVEEIKIPVPWGHIAGKWWGSQNVRPILGLHGWKDNCGTFDTLAPMLNSEIGFLAIDWPGNGHSSYNPPGMPYHLANGVCVIRYIAKYFNWTTTSIIGHSIGSAVGFLYAASFPRDIDFLIGIDLLIPICVPITRIGEILGQDVDNFLHADSAVNAQRYEPQRYTYEGAIEMKCKDLYHSVNDQFAPYLLNRALKKCENTEDLYQITDDPRTECHWPGWSLKQLMHFGHHIVCPVMNIKAKQSPYLDNKQFYFSVLSEVKKASKYCRVHELDGTHHVHLMKPESISEKINEFVDKHSAKDRRTDGQQTAVT